MVTLKWLLIVSVLLVLPGCSYLSAIGGVIDRSVASIKAAHDKKAQTLILANCAMSVGSYWRVLNDQQRAAINILCGGNDLLPTAKIVVVPIAPGRTALGN